METCEILEVSSSGDEWGWMCRRPAVARCADRGTSVCASHTENCATCKRSCPACIASHLEHYSKIPK